jgi:hypothetical protein
MRHFLALIAVLFATPSQAQSVDCMSPGYVASFEVPGLAELTCTEVFSFAFATPDGERHVRGIADLNADWAFQPDTVAAVEAAAHLAVGGLADLGNYRVSDVTILLLADQFRPAGEPVPEPTPEDPDPADPFEVWAQTWDPSAGAPLGDCRMTLFLWGAGGVTADFPTTLAHELFHCVQFATLSPDQMQTSGNRGDWWIEGSAEYFAAYAIPDGTGPASWGDDFNAGVAIHRPLYEMSYEAVNFFYWLGQRGGIAGLLPFLSGMSGVGGDAGQRAAMRDALSDDEWLDFAKAYIDETIAHPHGLALGLEGRFPNETVTVTQTGTQTRTFEPFAIISAQANYACGKWENRTRPAANMASKLEGTFDWGAGWKDPMDTRDGGEEFLRVAAMHTGDTPLTISLRVRRLAACAACQGTTELDRCLIGSWEGDTRPIIDLMRRAGAPISRNAMGPMFLLVNEDGTFVTSSVPIDFQTLTVDEHGTTTVDVRGVAGASAGRWAIASPGRLAGCSDVTDSTTASAETEGPNISASTALFGAGSGEESGVVSYSCGPDTMSTRVTMGRFGEVEFPFTRLTPPEEE